MTAVNDKRMDRIRKLLGCRTDVELADQLGTNQPQISRWRNKGFHGPATSALIDRLLGIIIGLKRELSSTLKNAARARRQREKEH